MKGGVRAELSSTDGEAVVARRADKGWKENSNEKGGRRRTATTSLACLPIYLSQALSIQHHQLVGYPRCRGADKLPCARASP